MKRAELLAPAGDMDCLKAAVCAGADAIYLGGSQYGARAYASNFSTEELIEAISYAHLFDVKIYLTVNTLVKEKEFDGLYDFICPLYEHGLDGVIVQDFGVIYFLSKSFPQLELHASTQMSIMNSDSARLLKQYGVTRIVPARELSLDEIKQIQTESGLDVEVFIHGAMCYGYSGQCLFSSFLGGRSGNRGRCAGPCRLPYDTKWKKDYYPLSLKDLCTIDILDELLDAGISSFKIEGRMKNPYYVAGVTAVYRKYMDLYYMHRSKSDNWKYKVDEIDRNRLKTLYVRTDLEKGYFHTQNDKKLVTLKKPCYATGSAEEIAWVEENFLKKERKYSVQMEAYFTIGEKAVLNLTDLAGNTVSVTSTSPVCKAQNKAVTRQDIVKQLSKLGATHFMTDTVNVYQDSDIFIPLKELNEMRRRAIARLEKLLLSPKYRVVPDEQNSNKSCATAILPCNTSKGENIYRSIGISTREQLDYLMNHFEELSLTFSCVELHWNLFTEYSVGEYLSIIKRLKELGVKKVRLLLPSVFRGKEKSFMCKSLSDELLKEFDGYYCGSLDALGFIQALYRKRGIISANKEFIADYNLYAYNHVAAQCLMEWGVTGFVSSYELNCREEQDLIYALSLPESCFETLVYGHVPFMYSAGCLKKTNNACDGMSEWLYLTDRYGKKLSVANYCKVCENVIYNAVPVSLHTEAALLKKHPCKLMFTSESKEEMMNILLFWKELLQKGETESQPEYDFTKGHFRKGIE